MADTTTEDSSSQERPPFGWHGLPQQLKQMIFEFAHLPKELRMHMHQFRQKVEVGGTKHPLVIEVVNKAEWHDILRFQAIKEIDRDVIQPLLTEKKIGLVLDLVNHPARCDASDPEWARTCIQDWETFIKKFPFRRLTTVVPFQPIHVDAPALKLHYLQLTLDRGASSTSEGTPNHSTP